MKYSNSYEFTNLQKRKSALQISFFAYKIYTLIEHSEVKHGRINFEV